MKKLILNLVIPITILTFVFLNKWWVVDIIDGPRVIMHGFPFIFVSPGIHTSLSFEFYILPLIADLLIYFTACFTLVAIINRLRKINLSTIQIYTIRIIALTSLLIYTPDLLFMDNEIYSLTRDFDIEVKQSRFGFGITSYSGPKHVYKETEKP
ncbi:hypothetical protein FUA48_10760 [Flavobacterium alkalisoli]|uniref:Uncharacterized protein n=1 Tax=Flavobacterium alkalisoli TaxID=2602769 RepID=A0A5B9FT87_9FLAO|nr:hypothetical protein [Flavobacterium alkalisoli]QEE50044.1 hypothetical protein FUA48_10760 [Flavobacterium alkalisoli]